MREILFRGKRVDNGEWVVCRSVIQALDNDVQQIFMPQLDTMCEVTSSNITGNLFGINGCVFLKVYPETVGQYTGLTDKNGKKIWEGDIIESSMESDMLPDKRFYWPTGVVKSEDGSYGILDKRGIFSQIYGFDLRKVDLEVIGNIHDNPELLEGSKDE